jgi:signal peptidase II
MIYFIVAALLVVADQVVKYLVRASLAVGQSVPFIPHVIQLTYVQNTGAAFSSFSGATFLLGLVSAAVSVFLVLVLVKKWVRHPYGRWPVALILAGALGNMIDRFVMGYVTDMFQTLFMNFAVFNVADICVVVGVIAMVLYVLLGWEKFEGKTSKKKSQEQDNQEEK